MQRELAHNLNRQRGANSVAASNNGLKYPIPQEIRNVNKSKNNVKRLKSNFTRHHEESKGLLPVGSNAGIGYEADKDLSPINHK